jgi:hypothetical protein
MKIASRYLLPVELLLSVLLLSWGLTGWIGGGLLWKTLHANGYNDEWGVMLCGIGGTQFAMAAIEARYGRRWPCSTLFYAVTARYWLAFLAGVLWLWILYMMLTVRGPSGTVLVLAVQAPACLFACAWIFFGNRKVACVLDPSVSTQRLQREILAEREEVLRGH